MRLINTKTLQLEYFLGEAPAYAILSHTWGPEEVSYAEMRDGTGQEKQGYQKIVKCCQIAADEGYSYAWIDTCTIDKSSSAELSEAINSMFQWYKKSAVCYAYLEDYDEADPSSLDKSRWFTRGWTLQELIAPSTVRFYSGEWKEFGTRKSLVKNIYKITKIDEDVLLTGSSFLYEKSIAKRMSWASTRQTTKPEDTAYCLLGIFDCTLPLLYGEGLAKAFIRLQENIIQASRDQSIFAW
ncbi:HET-domain-containing protein, partial [Microthyrium microscopicum]